MHIPFKKCDNFFSQNKIKKGYQCISKEIQKDYSFDKSKFTYINDIFEGEKVPKDICNWIDAHFLEESKKYNSIHNEMNKFLTQNCNDFKNVYHGTSLKNALQSDGYLCPQYGDFVKDAYGVNYIEEELHDYWDNQIENGGVVFASDKFHINKSLNAIMHHTNDTWGKGNGVLMKLDAELFDRAGQGGYHEVPLGVEPNDYYTDACVKIDGIITDNQLFSQHINLKNRHSLDKLNTLQWTSFTKFKNKLSISEKFK